MARPQQAGSWPISFLRSVATTSSSNYGTTAIRLDSARNDALVTLAVRQSLDVIATNNVHYATPARRPLATALAAVRARRSLDEIDGWLPPSASAHLRSGPEQARRFARYPGVVERAAELGRDCAFDLKLVAPNLPAWPVPPGHTEMTWLRHLTEAGALNRYGPRDAEKINGAYKQIDHELELIDRLGFPGYFLIVWDIVQFCGRSNILCQGRGSAANSAVCYALGITAVDAVHLGLLFERFLSPERDGPPDIDIDIESDRREEAIQYVYERYGRENAAQVANVITYRPKSAVRDMGKALGHSIGQLDAWSKQVDHWGPMSATREQNDHGIPESVLELADALQNFPRHLGIHSGGMVICDRPVSEVVPVEWGRMEGRTVFAVGQGRLRGGRSREVRPARPRDALCVALRLRLHQRPLRRRARAVHHSPRRRGLRHVVQGRFRRRVPGGESRPDGHTAPPPTAQLL